MKRVSPATTLAGVALFFSMTGAGMAATGYRITSIWQIKPSVRHALRGAQGTPGTVGPVGPTGVTGPAGAQGPAGTVDWSRVHLVSGPAVVFPSQSEQESRNTSAGCPIGEHVITGGYEGSNEIVTWSSPTHDLTGWAIEVRGDPATTSGWAQPWAECAS